jgi:alanine racemase
MTGVRCICIQNSSDHLHCFGEPVKIDTALQLKELKMQKVMDVEFMENQLLKMINKLKLRLIADAIEKVYEIQKEDSKCGKQSELLFSVNFDHGLGIK